MLSGLSVVVLSVVAVFVHDVGALPPPIFSTTTTTTTTTTTESPSEPWPEPVVESSCTCCGASSCIQKLTDVYTPILQDNDFARLAENIDDLCQLDLPAAERCLRRSNSIGCYTDLIVTMYQRLCDAKTALKEGRSCWSQGFQQGMQRCLSVFMRPGGSEGGPCRALNKAKACIWHMMGDLPLCTASDAVFVIDYVRGNTLPLCPHQ